MYLVSACLANIPCRYNGQAKPCEAVMRLVAEGKVIPVCPEELGGLGTPRQPSEQRGEKVFSKDGTDVTAAFQRGAEEALKIGLAAGATQAILKSRSPSCGVGFIYDGTFSGKLIPGDGVFTRLCKANGMRVITEEDL
jgi:uncharacterized protein YbbK (DUF523 family)